MLYKPLNKNLEKKIYKYAKGKKVIFVSQAATNMCWARLICKYVIEQGYVPVNYFTAFGHFVHEIADLDTMIESINSLIVRCNEMWAFGAISEGMWYEIKMCKELGIPVKYFCIAKLPQKVLRILENDVKYTQELAKKIKRFKKFDSVKKL